MFLNCCEPLSTMTSNRSSELVSLLLWEEKLNAGVHSQPGHFWQQTRARSQLMWGVKHFTVCQANRACERFGSSMLACLYPCLKLITHKWNRICVLELMSHKPVLRSSFSRELDVYLHEFLRICQRTHRFLYELQQLGHQADSQFSLKACASANQWMGCTHPGTFNIFLIYCS